MKGDSKELIKAWLVFTLLIALCAVAILLFPPNPKKGCDQRDDSCAVGCP